MRRGNATEWEREPMAHGGKPVAFRAREFDIDSTTQYVDEADGVAEDRGARAPAPRAALLGDDEQRHDGDAE